MGIFWRITQGGYQPSQTLTLREPKGTFSEDWPFLWRLGQYHYLLEVQDTRYQKGYYIYSHSLKDGTLRFHRLSHTPYVTVSVGPELKQFWIETREKEILSIVYTGVRLAGPFVWPRDGVSRRFFKNHTKSNDITWT